MKIGIMGAHSTGKTTHAKHLVEQAREEGRVAHLLTGVARSCQHPIEDPPRADAQEWIFNRMLHREIAESKACDTLVCDRTLLDVAAYTAHGNMMTLLAQQIEVAICWMGTYDRIYFHHPDGRAIEADNIRPMDRLTQENIDQILASWVKHFPEYLGDVIHVKGETC